MGRNIWLPLGGISSQILTWEAREDSEPGDKQRTQSRMLTALKYGAGEGQKIEQFHW